MDSRAIDPLDQPIWGVHAIGSEVGILHADGTVNLRKTLDLLRHGLIPAHKVDCCWVSYPRWIRDLGENTRGGAKDEIGLLVAQVQLDRAKDESLQATGALISALHDLIETICEKYLNDKESQRRALGPGADPMPAVSTREFDLAGEFLRQNGRQRSKLSRCDDPVRPRVRWRSHALDADYRI